MLNPELLKILCCPLGKADLKLVPAEFKRGFENDFLICTRCSIKFPVREGIPVLLIEEAVLPDGIKDLNELDCQKNLHTQSEV